MARNYGEEYEARVERAHERGYDSLNEERQYRELAYEMGADREDVEYVAHVLYAYEPGHYDDDGWHGGSLDGEPFGIEDFRELYAEMNDVDIDEVDDMDFYEWLQEWYDNN